MAGSETTTDLWCQLCGDFDARRSQVPSAEVPGIVAWFLKTAGDLFRESSPRMRDALEIAGDCYSGLGLAVEAEASFRHALALAVDAPGDRSRIATKLALLLESDPARASEARDAYRIATDIDADTPGASQLPTLLNNLASLEIRLGDSDAGVACYERAITIARQHLGSQNLNVALLQSNLAIALTNLGRFAEAEALHLQVLAIREGCYGSNHPDVAASMANLGVVYHDKREFLKAERFYRGALDLLKHFREPTDPEVRWIRGNLERLPHIAVRKLSSTSRI